jgi:hypothetical protein
MEIELIKKDLIHKFGFDHVPDVSKFNKTVTVEEKRRKLKDYRKSIKEMKPDVHKTYEDEDEDELMLPEIYHRIVDHGRRLFYIYTHGYIVLACHYKAKYNGYPVRLTHYCGKSFGGQILPVVHCYTSKTQWTRTYSPLLGSQNQSTFVLIVS